MIQTHYTTHLDVVAELERAAELDKSNIKLLVIPGIVRMHDPHLDTAHLLM